MTVNVSPSGALLIGVRGNLKIASEVTLARRHRQAKYVIAWVGEPGTAKEGQMEVTRLDRSVDLWDDVVIPVDVAESLLAGSGAGPKKAKTQAAS